VGRRPALEIETRWNLPVFIDNDANLGALAEHWWGAARDVDCATYIKVATGVGAGHIVDGRLFRGANGIAGEIGHTAVAGTAGHRCRCGLRGCLEAEVGSFALVHRAQERLPLYPDSTLAGIEPLELGHIVDAANQGDALATELVAEAGRYLGVAVANLVNLMNPARVVIGGRLANADSLLLAPLIHTMASRALASSVERTDVRLAELGVDHIAIGAATLVLEAALASPNAFTRPLPPARAVHSPAITR
jgi:predicted NBD/HSP70 family sugar kinase